MSDRVARGRVCVIYTGGTIGMRSITPELDGDQAVMLSADEIEAALRRRSDLDVPYDFRPLVGEEGRPFTPLVSSRVGPHHWVQIADTVQRHYADYEGFVVLHGTDTMAWTASALSFMLANLAKPVVLTGSQRPILAAPSDAVPNFVNAVMLAGRGDETIPAIPEVIICFGDLVLRGNRATKVSAASLQGFDTPNVPHLGRVGRRFEINPEALRPGPARVDAFFVRRRIASRVADVMLYPGMSAEQVARALEGCDGAVLRTFGAGNAPGGDEVLEVLASAVRHDVVLVNVTQSNEGTVEAGMLTGSRALTDRGVLSGLDLTAEAAMTKLMVLLGEHGPAAARDLLQLDQRGEQSMDLVELRASGTDPEEEGVTRVILTQSLHARARPDRLVSAVLRVRTGTAAQASSGVDGAEGTGGPGGGDMTEHALDRGPASEGMRLFLNDWHADQGAEADLRALPRRPSVVDRHGASRVTLDITEVARGVLEVGAPVTLTVVPASPRAARRVDVTLSLFMERAVAEAS